MIKLNAMNADFLIDQLLESQHLHSRLPNGRVVRDPEPGKVMKGTIHIWLPEEDDIEEEFDFLDEGPVAGGIKKVAKAVKGKVRKDPASFHEIGPHGMSYRQAELLTGGLSQPDKMPFHAMNLPSWYCQIGMKLHAVKNNGRKTSCSNCYAAGGRYISDKKVGAAAERRYMALNQNIGGGLWTDAMATMINHHARIRSKRGKPEVHFRWNDAGDVQSREHVAHIMEVARKTMGNGGDTQKVHHWLATREGSTHVLGYIRAAREAGIPDHEIIPENMMVRISHPFVDEVGKKFGLEHFPRVQFSTVTSVDPHYSTPEDRAKHPSDRLPDAMRAEGYHHCPAPMQGDSCGSCRNCWEDKPVAYSDHGHGGHLPSPEWLKEVQEMAKSWFGSYKKEKGIKDLNPNLKPEFSDHHKKIMSVIGEGDHRTTVAFRKAAVKKQSEVATKIANAEKAWAKLDAGKK